MLDAAVEAFLEQAALDVVVVGTTVLLIVLGPRITKWIARCF